MKVNLDRQEFYGIAALTLQFLSEHENFVEDEDLRAVIKKLKAVVRAPLRTYFLANPDLRITMKRLIPALTGEKTVNTVLEIQSDQGDIPNQKLQSLRRIAKDLLNKEDIDKADFALIVEHHGLRGKVEYEEPETYEDHQLNLPLKYLPIGEEQ